MASPTGSFPSAPGIIRFSVSEEMVRAFARLTGDFSSLHMNEEMARKTRFRGRIVHGMLPLGFLALLQRELPDRALRFEKLRVRFLQPVHIGDEILLEVALPESEGATAELRATWRRAATGESVTRASGRLSLRDEAPTASAQEPSGVFVRGELSEAEYGISDMDGRSESLDFELTAGSVAAYQREILGAGAEPGATVPAVCPNLLSALMLSPLVGMRLPGRNATFMGFSLEFARDALTDRPHTLRGTVEKCSELAETIFAAVSIREGADAVAEGRLEAMVNAPPKSMPSPAEIRESHLDLGLADRVVVVTGASRGIGETTAKLFALLGSKVVVNYHRGASDAERIVGEIREAGGDAIALPCDVRDEARVRELFARVVERYGGVDVLVNNAVKEFRARPIPELSWDDYLDELEVSVRGLHACCREVIPLFVERGRGKIVNLSTVAVDVPVSGQSRYITCKSAVVGYTKSLAVELAPHGIQANLVVPNMTDTDLVSGIPSAYREKLAESRAYKRHVHPAEVAQAIAFLASDWANAITGQQVVLNLGEPPFA